MAQTNDETTTPAIACPACHEGTLKTTPDGKFLACYMDYCDFIATPDLLARAAWYRGYFNEGPTPDA
jgi:hypothetical protein